MSAGGPGLLRRKAPELLLEAFFVVFAVVVALAVDEWNEDRELQARVERAQASVQAELRANRAELESTRESVATLFAGVHERVEALRAGETPQGWDAGATLPDFSDAAWETARVTGAVAHMDYAWVLEVARVYQTQARADDAQDVVIRTLGDLSARGPALEVMVDLQGELFIALQLYENLDRKYDEVLMDGEGG